MVTKISQLVYMTFINIYFIYCFLKLNFSTTNTMLSSILTSRNQFWENFSTNFYPILDNLCEWNIPPSNPNRTGININASVQFWFRLDKFMQQFRIQWKVAHNFLFAGPIDSFQQSTAHFVTNFSLTVSFPTILNTWDCYCLSRCRQGKKKIWQGSKQLNFFYNFTLYINPICCTYYLLIILETYSGKFRFSWLHHYLRPK